MMGTTARDRTEKVGMTLPRIITETSNAHPGNGLIIVVASAFLSLTDLQKLSFTSGGDQIDYQFDRLNATESHYLIYSSGYFSL